MANVQAQLFTQSHLSKSVWEYVLLAMSEICPNISRKYHVSMQMYKFLVAKDRHEERKKASECDTRIGGGGGTEKQPKS